MGLRKIKKSMHIHDAIRYVTSSPGHKVRHKMWKKEYYVSMTPAGNFEYHTPEGDYSWNWLKKTHPKIGWEVLDESSL